MKVFKEGEIEILAGESKTKDSIAFYNDERKDERTINVLLVKVLMMKRLLKENSIGLDMLSASGIRGMRLYKESGAFKDFVLNDFKTYNIIKENLKRNKIELKVENKDARRMFIGRFDYIDVDPFGSPLPYFPSAILNSRVGTIIGVTATDTSPLYGSAKKGALRKYFAEVMKTSYYNEMGLRILLFNLERLANIYDFSIEPLLYLIEKHYLRIYLRIVPYREKRLGYIYQCERCPNRKLEESEKCEVCGGKMKRIGPLWLDKTINKSIVDSLLSIILAEKGPYLEYFAKEANEKDIPWYYTTTEIAKFEKEEEKKLTYYLNKGAVPTPLNPKGFKIELAFKDLLNL